MSLVMISTSSVGTSEGLIFVGVGFLLGGTLGFVALKVKLLPDLKIKWVISVASIILGLFLMLIGCWLDK